MQEMDAAQLAPELTEDRRPDNEDAQLQAILEAIVYITDEPLTAQQIAAAHRAAASTRSSGCWTSWWRSTPSPSTG